MNAVDQVLANLDDVNSWQEELYVALHQNPELSMQESETAEEIARRLESFGYEVQRIGGGVVGRLRNGEGPTVLFRADIDALPVAEASGLPYASTKTMVDRDGVTQPVMHACGHDHHITAGLGAAALLAQSQDAWAGTYIALFQPGEETAEGARSMVKDGLVEKVGPIDVALGQHVLTSPAAGQVATHSGPTLSAAASLRIHIVGKGSHGSMPHLGIDPVLMAASIVVRLQGIVAREINPNDFAVVTVGSIKSGTKANVIPGDATMLLNIRAYSEDIKAKLIDSITRIARAECEASGAPEAPTIEVFDEYPLTDNDAGATSKVTAAFTSHFGEDRVQPLGRVTASEDFSVIPDAFGVPYSYWGFGGFTPDQVALPNHNPGFAPAMQPTLRTGTEAAVTAILAFLGKGN
ncbi:amidohydrolase [Gulosibacter molinativorax]|uniref:Amidohydrolase n=1 Tax=Gulosibacter molinativorax TaxID=256821 RepID=A0ABT7C760_9MICO|nr:amidohydrolase [Gulosibacter molinativorax]MDJ1370875.1 amidohydrolase [Gulosibacter molinativorax]QUY62212.1 Amidohydrolase [Gulosibacter molinativorax]